MKELDDRHYLTEPDEPNWCAAHECKKPCEACRAEERD